MALVFELVVMGFACNVLRGVGEGGEREGLVNGFDAENFASLCLQFNHSAVLVVATVLRMGVVDVLLADSTFPQTDGTGGFAVGVN